MQNTNTLISLSKISFNHFQSFKILFVASSMAMEIFKDSQLEQEKLLITSLIFFHQQMRKLSSTLEKSLEANLKHKFSIVCFQL